MNLVFISTDKYPDQHAAAIRHSTAGKGFTGLGHKVWFYLLSPQDWESSEIEYNGVFYKTLNDYRGSNKILKAINFFYSLLILRKNISELHHHSTLNGIVVFTIDNLVIYNTLKISKKLGIKIFHERTELPYVFQRKNSLIGKIKYNYYLKRLVPKFDGLFVITNKLKDFFTPFNKNVIKVNIMVDTDFFSVKSDSFYDFRYIAYCGTMQGDKDGVNILIKAFAKLLKNFPDYKLLLIGKSSNKEAIKDILIIIDELGINDKIVFTGFVPREDMPGLLSNAELLVVSKPDNEQNSGNFPIKVGEYLSTGVPVVLTKVGEIPMFINDGYSGFLALPGSVESFYSKMYNALADYDSAAEVGLNGRILAKRVFDYKSQTKLMSEYILS